MPFTLQQQQQQAAQRAIARARAGGAPPMASAAPKPAPGGLAPGAGSQAAQAQAEKMRAAQEAANARRAPQTLAPPSAVPPARPAQPAPSPAQPAAPLPENPQMAAAQYMRRQPGIGGQPGAAVAQNVASRQQAMFGQMEGAARSSQMLAGVAPAGAASVLSPTLSGPGPGGGFVPPAQAALEELRRQQQNALAAQANVYQPR